MSKDRDPYSRHYWRLVDDPKFAEVFDDDHHYATWSRLLMLADQAWPASAHLPASARKASVKKLAEVKLIDLLAGGRFRMHGMQAEREKRSQQAKDAAAARWSSPDSNADSNAPSNTTASPNGMPSKAEQSKAEKSITEQRRQRADLEAFYAVTNRAPSPRQLKVLEDYQDTFDVTGTERATKIILANPGDPIGALLKDLSSFRASRRASAA